MTFEVSHIRGLPFSTYAKFWEFLIPSLPLVRISRNLSVLLYTEISNFSNPPPPLSAYVLNGSPLTAAAGRCLMNLTRVVILDVQPTMETPQI